MTISRESCVQVLAHDINAAGTGFFIDDLHVVTSFHVVARTERSVDNKVRHTISKQIDVVRQDGTSIKAKLVSIPSEEDRSPYDQDFAILRLLAKPQFPVRSVKLSEDIAPPVVGSEVFFSGFPLDVDAMLTHKGYVSGFTSGGMICLQAPINEGNSGGAVLNINGEVIGIVASREGEISRSLKDQQKQIAKSRQVGQVEILGVNTLDATEELIKKLDKYISTGIGYAIPVSFLKRYLSKNPRILKT